MKIKIAPALGILSVLAGSPAQATSFQVLADNQFHNPFAGAYPGLNSLFDGVESVAIRPPQPAALGKYGFLALMARLPSADWILHLGDVADVSCPIEIETFLKVMETTSKPWVFAPGNHDGYFTGNSQHSPKNKKTWEPACGGTRLTKADVIRKYVEARLRANAGREGRKERTTAGDGSEEFSGEERYGGDISIAYAGKVVPDRPQQSFVVQQVRFPVDGGCHARVIVLDTAQYEKPPKYIVGAIRPGRMIAGVTGEMRADQKDIAERWFREAAAAGDLVLLAGHHQLKTGKPDKGLKHEDTQWAMQALIRAGGSVYLSAHTHVGGTRELSFAKATIYDLNTASLIDWPLGLRTVEVTSEHVASTETLFDDATNREIFGQGCYAHSEWRVAPGGFFSYAHYRKVPSGPTGRKATHYAMLAELSSLRDGLAATKTADPEWLKEVDANIKSGIEKFNSPLSTSSREEARLLSTLVKAASEQYESKWNDLSPDQRSLMGLYDWCQMWWAAQEDVNIFDGKPTRSLKSGWNDTKKLVVPWKK